MPDRTKRPYIPVPEEELREIKHEAIEEGEKSGTYMLKLMEYKRMYNMMNNKIQAKLAEIYAEREERKKRRITVEKPKEGHYAPCFYMPRGSWASGSISEEIDLKPVYNLPIFPQYEMGSLQAIYGKLGSGKTFLLSSLACYAIRSKREVVFSPLNDRSNSFTYAGIPLFTYDKRTKDLYEILTKIVGVEPAAVPIITLNFLRPGEKIYDTVKHPPTIFDRIIEIDDPLSFRIDFKVLLDELKEVSEMLGYGDLRGIICVRNLRRHDRRLKSDIDVQEPILSPANYQIATLWRMAMLNKIASVKLKLHS